MKDDPCRELVLRLGKAQVDAMFGRQDEGPLIDDAEFIPFIESVLTAFETADIESQVVEELWEYAYSRYDRYCKEADPAFTTSGTALLQHTGQPRAASGWSGRRLGNKFYPKLSKGKKAFDDLRRYFSGKNLVRTIRDHFASHYEIGYLPRVLDELTPSDEFHFVSSEHSVNTFYSVAEKVRNVALIATADEVGDDEMKSWNEARARVAIRVLLRSTPLQDAVR